MFHKVTALVYVLFGGMVGHKVAVMAEKDTTGTLLAVLIGAAASVMVYFLLRFLRFAESAYRREMVAPPRFFQMGRVEEPVESKK